MGSLKTKRSGLRQIAYKFRTGPLLRRRVARGARKRSALSATCIAVTGSSTKSTTTALLGEILGGLGDVRTQALDNSLNSLLRTISRSTSADFVVVELGIGPNVQMSEMANALRPDVSVVTMIQLEHYATYRSLDGIAAEKGKIVEAMSSGGLAVLNADDPNVLAMRDKTSARIVTFGQSLDADYCVTEIRSDYPMTMQCKLKFGGATLELSTQFFGEHFWLPVAAAAATGLELGVTPGEVKRKIEAFSPLPARTQLIQIPGGPDFIVDTAKAPADALGLPFKILKKANAVRKRAVVGMISDYSGPARKIYTNAYKMAREVADEVIFVGVAAERARPAEEDVLSGRYRAFETPRDAFEYLEDTALDGELILLKGSANLHLERLALGFGERVKCWVPICYTRDSCFQCGEYLNEYDERAFRRRAKPRIFSGRFFQK